MTNIVLAIGKYLFVDIYGFFYEIPYIGEDFVNVSIETGKNFISHLEQVVICLQIISMYFSIVFKLILLCSVT